VSNPVQPIAIALTALAIGACSSPAANGGASPPPKPSSWTTRAWKTVCRYDTSALPELSGLTPSVRHRNLLWGLNDSGNEAVLFGIDAKTCSIRAQHTVAADAVDWEALASGRNAAGRPVLWVADIGDNSRNRSSVSVFEVAEPDLGTTSGPATSHEFRYPDGPRDAEALLATPGGTRLFVLSKSLAGRTFEIPVTSGIALAESVGAAPAFATDAATNPASGDYVVRDYAGLTRFRGPIPGTRLGRTSPPRQRQAEAVAFSRSGRWLYTASEGDPRLRRAKVLRVPRVPAGAAPSAFGPGG
jgi:hypothetical protein